MTKTKKIYIALAVVLVAGIYIYVYADWFKPAQVQIFHRLTAGRPTRRWSKTTGIEIVPALPTVAFGLDQKLKLTEIKVVSLAALETNKSALAVWHLVSSSNSVPVKGFLYGDYIRGMVPYVKSARALPLQPNMVYRLFLKADSVEGHHDFSLGKMPEPAPAPAPAK